MTDIVFNNAFWVSALGMNFVKKPEHAFEMGKSILYSLEMMYDIKTRENIRLPEEDKKDIYAILKWMLTEFTKIRLKSNTNVTTKRIRWSEWIASLYFNKINSGLHRISEINRKNKRKDNLKRIEQVIKTMPLYLVNQITSASLKGIVNMVNDKDSFLQMKYTIKGPSGPGDKNAKNISNTLRKIDPSHIGIIDINTSAAQEPGVVGMLCPLNDKIYGDGKFTEEMEPNSWQETFNDLVSEYRKSQSITSALIIEKDLGIDVSQDDIEHSLDSSDNLAKAIDVNTSILEDVKEVPLEDSGHIVYEVE